MYIRMNRKGEEGLNLTACRIIVLLCDNPGHGPATESETLNW